MSQADLTEPPAAWAALGRELALLGLSPGAVVDRELLVAYAAASAPNSLRAFRADVTTFDAWCQARGSRCLPASPQLATAFLSARAGAGPAPASLTRYRASIAKLHRLCRFPDPCQDELVKLTLAAHRRTAGVAQKQARPLRFKGAVRDLRWCWFSGQGDKLIPTIGMDGNEDDEKAVQRGIQSQGCDGGDLG